MAVVTTGELDDLRPAGESAREPNCRHRGLSPGTDQSNLLNRVDARHNFLSQQDLSGLGAPKDNPWAAAWVTDSITAGCACPKIAGPHDPTRSTYSLPSASVTYGPLPETMKRGVPPTAPNARTGEFTPPGVTAWPRANHSALWEISSCVTRSPYDGLRTQTQSGFDREVRQDDVSTRALDRQQ